MSTSPSIVKKTDVKEKVMSKANRNYITMIVEAILTIGERGGVSRE